MIKLFQYIRSLFTSEVKDEKKFPRVFKVNVLIEHPYMIGGHLGKIQVKIDAHSPAHARQRLKDELRLVIGNARRV